MCCFLQTHAAHEKRWTACDQERLTFELSPGHFPNQACEEQSPAKHRGEYSLVRTNHGLVHPDAGYTEGPDYKSSVIRRATAKAFLKKLNKADDILDVMRTNKFEQNNPNNMARDTDKMKTTSQMLLNLTKKIFILNYFDDRIEGFKGIKTDLPSDYKPNIQIIVKEIK